MDSQLQASTNNKFDVISIPITTIIPQDKVDEVLASPPFIAIPGATNF